MSFAERVYKVVKGIPKGKTLSYKEVSIRAGKLNAGRAVGTILSKNTDPSIPCHRVIRSDGKIAQYNGLQGEKEKLLRKEGAIQ